MVAARTRLSALFAPTADAYLIWGRLALSTSLALSLIVVLFVAWRGDWVVAVFLPVLLSAALAVVWLFRRPTINLYVVLVGFVIVANNEAGFQLREIVYVLYLYATLAHWYASEWLSGERRFLHTTEDKALFLFLILVPCTIPLTVVFEGSLVGVVSELFSLSLLALYFPLKETIARSRGSAHALAIVVVLVGVLVALRNLFEYGVMLGNVTMAWQIATGRVVTNDSLLCISSLFSLALLVTARTWRSAALMSAALLTCFGGLLLTQSRGYWLAFLLGAAVMFVALDRRRKLRLLLVGGVGTVAGLAIGYILVGPYMNLLLGGLTDRFASVGSAAFLDDSLINRWRETGAVLERIKLNPIVGYGMGVSYSFYDIVHLVTDSDAFVHNGYVGLWYKFGLWGLGLMLFFWAGTIRRGILAFRIPTLSPFARTCGLAGAIGLCAFTLSTITSNPFFVKDTVFIFSLTAGVSAGAWRRCHLEAHGAEVDR